MTNFTNNYFTQLQSRCGDDDDFRVRTLNLGTTVKVVSLDSMCDDNKVVEYVVKPLLAMGQQCTPQQVLQATFATQVVPCVNFDDVVTNYLAGYTLVFADGADQCVAIDTFVATGRTVTEPPTSAVMRGPREGFVESVKTNLMLIRKRLRTDKLKTTTLTVGKYTNTMVVVCHLDGVAAQHLVDKVIQSISAINIDGILDSSYLSQYLDKQHTYLFQRVGSTEKPDVAVAKLLEGRIAVVVDGSPMVLTLPYLFIEDLQSPGDYYENNEVTSLGRILRFVSALISVLLPAVYVCLQKYNYQIIPLKFLITILNATEAIPFSPLTEMLLVIIIFDILREANLRMPSAVGMSLSLVGAIVLGDAAVKAGLLGAPAVMVGALSGIGLYTMPKNTLVFSILRLGVTLVGGLMGLYGVVLAMLAIVLYLTSLQSYSAPFLAPYAPRIQHDKQDAVFQDDLATFNQRPHSFSNVNRTRRRK
ncbi:MAG: spore germination protein [Clostridia bacterium]|nr:spore germination protein [Clostridia bacterium]